jgi:hypothetical protein
MPSPPPSWWQAAIERRRKGATLQVIADEFGVSRERVRQVLAIHMGDLDSPEGRGYARADAEVFTDLLAPDTIAQWGRRGKVGTERFGAASYYCVKDVLDYFMELMDRTCAGPGCTNAVGRLNEPYRYCPTCTVERKRYCYPFLSEKGRKTANASAMRWAERNPEAAWEASYVAGAAWRARKRADRAGPEVRFRLDQLVRDFPVSPIKGPERLAVVQARIDELRGRECGLAEELYLDLLDKRIRIWEARTEEVGD